MYARKYKYKWQFKCGTPAVYIYIYMVSTTGHTVITQKTAHTQRHIDIVFVCIVNCANVSVWQIFPVISPTKKVLK